ncbi:MAG: hypothetical protein R3220_08230 [Balneolaceae bacterium]|nr:hypothetical protein [Balneolaceae bacterium]
MAGKDLEYYNQTDPKRLKEQPRGQVHSQQKAPLKDEASAGSQNGACAVYPEKVTCPTLR